MPWYQCATCGQVSFESAKHKCPAKIRKIIEGKIDGTIKDEMDMFDLDYKTFKADPHTKFLEYLAEKGAI